jgi:hypothetical protein
MMGKVFPAIVAFEILPSRALGAFNEVSMRAKIGIVAQVMSETAWAE